MIHYVVSADRAYCVEIFLRSWGKAVADRFNVVSYRALSNQRTLPSGTYIFTDLERLAPAAVGIATEAWNGLATAVAPSRLLNHPQRAMRRLDLLEALRAQGLGHVRARRLSDSRRPDRFPVFLRHEVEHLGSFTPLLHSQRALDLAVLKVFVSGFRPSRTLLVEYCDTSDATGIFRKYSAFFLAGQVVPRHLIFSRNWVLKQPDIIEPDKLREELAYLDANPHQQWVAEVFRLARIDYGRIDYSLRDGVPEAWEINTNPQVMMAPEEYDPEHLPAQRIFADRMMAAFRAIDTTGNAGSVRFTASPRVRRRFLLARMRARAGTWAAVPLRRVILPAVRRAYRLVKWAVEPTRRDT